MAALRTPRVDPDAPTECVIFVDCPDPDNFVLVVCAALLRGARHVVLTGRPANFNVASRPFNPRTCARTPDEVDGPEDGRSALRASAAHLRRFARSQGIVDLRLYDGGVAATALVAHAEHVHEYLFGRPDLAARCGADRASASGGECVTPAGYAALVAALDAKGRARARTVREWLATDGDGSLAPLGALAAACSGRRVEALVGGPLTALAAVAKAFPAFAASVERVRAMACAWDVGAANLFANQFNVGADLWAAVKILTEASPLGCGVSLYTTEFCKAALALTPAEIRSHAAPEIADLYDLWHALTGGRGTATLFDLAPLLDALDGPLAPSVAVRCQLGRDGVFRIEPRETAAAASGIRATAPVTDAATAAKAKAKLLAALGAAKVAAAAAKAGPATA